MRTADEIFATIGVPIAFSSAAYGPNRYTGFRAFNESDIKAIQDEAFQEAVNSTMRLLAENASPATCGEISRILGFPKKDNP